jgi:hypothetical protein
MAETDVYQARMRHSRFDGTNGMRPRKLLTQLLKIISLLEEGNMEDIDAAYNQFSRDSALYEFSMNKIQIVADTSEREVLSYRTLREVLGFSHLFWISVIGERHHLTISETHHFTQKLNLNPVAGAPRLDAKDNEGH